MSKEGADIAGKRLATAALVFAWCVGAATVIYAIAQLLQAVK